MRSSERIRRQRKMGMLNKFKDLIGVEDYEDDEVMEYEEDSYKQPSYQDR